LVGVRTAVGRTARVAVFVLVLLALVMPSASAATTRVWLKRYNGPANQADEAADLAFDNSGNVYVAGRSVGSGTQFDYAVIKYGANGAVKWTRRYNGPANGWDGARAIAVDDDGNVYVTGKSDGSGTRADFATIKYNSSGTQKWVKRYTSSDYDDEGVDIVVDHAGNIIVTGVSAAKSSGNDFFTIKYAPGGTVKWAKRYDGPIDGGDKATAVAVDSQNNVYVTGASEGEDTGWDFCTIKYSAGGTLLWAKRWNSKYNRGDGATAIVVDPYDGIYVTGYSYRSDTNSDYVTVKYATDGTEVWEKRYDGPGKGPDVAWAIAYDYDRVYVTGAATSKGGDLDYATICYKRDGSQQWVKLYDGPAGGDDNASTGSGTSGDYFTIAYGAGGYRKWVNRYDGPSSKFDQGNAVGVCPTTGNVYVTGGSGGVDSRSDYATIKYTP
jgi:uncharacterized delta-60 repeat protein